MNFGNPQKPEIMGQFAGAIMGMAEACKVLDFPVVSGNVSLYNETEGRPILPTPTIGAVGVIDDIAKAVGSRLTQAGLGIVLIGETEGWLGQSLYLREACGREEGAPPPVDLAVERRNGDFVRSQIAMRPRRSLPRPVGRRPAGGAGRDGHRRRHRAWKSASPPETAVPSHAFFYGEDQAPLCHRQRLGRRRDRGGRRRPACRPCCWATRAGRRWWSKGLLSLPLSDIKAAHEAWLPGYMAATE